MRPRFTLFVISAAMVGCVITPNDEYAGVPGTASSVSIWGYHNDTDETVAIEALRPDGTWIPVATATPNPAQMLTYGGMDFYKWSTSALIPSPAWQAGYTGYRTVLRATSNTGQQLMSVHRNVLNCYNNNDTLQGFYEECASDANPNIRVYTSTYCPDHRYRGASVPAAVSVTSTHLKMNYLLYGSVQRGNAPTSITTAIAGNATIPSITGLSCSVVSVNTVSDEEDRIFDETHVVSVYSCSLPLTNAIRCDLARIRQTDLNVSYLPAAFNSCSTARRHIVYDVSEHPDSTAALNAAQAACVVTPPTTPGGTPDLRATLITSADWRTIRYTVANIGSATASNYKVRYCLDFHCAEVQGPTLPPGQSQTFSPMDPRPPTGPAGSPVPIGFVRSVYADPYDTLVEVTNSNNGANQTNP